VLDLGIKPDVTRVTWELDVEGVRDGPLVLRWDDLSALPQTDAVSDFHCVTAWSVLDCRWRGVRFRDFAAEVAPDPAARFVVFGGYDGYTTNLPLDVCQKDDVLLAHGYDGTALTREHGGPVRVVVPSRYAWKSCKWLKSVAFSAVDQPGFWETRGYHNEADPWKEERFA
jgi:DMSO/TMAO reductase YedYZ molybdopterin-dependent catalytic subunit